MAFPMRAGPGIDGMRASPDEQNKRERKTDARTIKRVAQAFAPYTFQVVVVMIFIILATVLGLVNPLLISVVFDEAIGKHNVRLLVLLVGIMVVVPIVTGLLGVGQTYLNNLIGQKVMRDLRNQLYAHLHQLSLRFFTATRTGEILSRLSNDVDGIQAVITNTATGIVFNLSTALSTIIAMLLLSPLLTLISLGLLPIFLWITYKIGKVRRMTSKETQESLARLSILMQETLSVSGMLLMKTFGRQQYAQERFANENQRLTALEVRQQMIGRWFIMSMNIFFSVSPVLIYLIAGLQIITSPANPVMTLGKIVAFTTLQNRLYFPIGQLLGIQVNIQGALALFDRLFEYLDLPIEIKNRAGALRLQPGEIHGEITFQDVSFTYRSDSPIEPSNLFASTNRKSENSETSRPSFAAALADTCQPTRLGKIPHPILLEPLAEHTEETSRATLNHISFTIQPGQLAALVGPSGAGKTTITYLVPRLYEAERGVVAIDGYDVRDLALESLTGCIGMVTQETYLFHASVRENLLYARQDAAEAEMIAAAKAAAIHERILELDQGYDTVVGERGYRLSGGEKQRLAIARVILKDPRILILDEATSSLDTHSERLIQEALQRLMKGRTTLAIAHRLSTILTADVILVVERGQIVERGTHQELLALDGLYARLYHEQFAKEVIEEIGP